MSADRVIEYWPDGRSEPLRLRWSYDIHSDSSQVVKAIGKEPPPEAADLWDIAAACHAVDRLVQRPPEEHWKPAAWGRDISVRMDVRNPLLWKRHRRLLEGLLAWLTCDRWSLSFRDLRLNELQKQEIFEDKDSADKPKEQVTMLFSGGMDSTAGALHEASQGQNRSLLAVSVVSNPRMNPHLKKLNDTIRRRLRTKMQLLPFRLHLAKSVTESMQSENSQRTRGLVFLAAGITAALTAGCRKLLIYENGIGAINLPCTWGQVGAQAARPVHPRTIRVMQRIADIVADACGRARLTIENKALWRTKAELIGGPPPEHDDILAASISCDTAFAARSEPDLPPHCGECTSCLLRRQALLVAGRPAVEHQEYRGHSKIEDRHLHAMLWQVARARRALDAEDAWTSFVQEFPDVLCVPSVLDRKTELLALYRRYCAEWTSPMVARHLGFRPSTWGLFDPTR